MHLPVTHLQASGVKIHSLLLSFYSLLFVHSKRYKNKYPYTHNFVFLHKNLSFDVPNQM